jgi:transcriptional regulator with XRE-family HTH domain
MSEKRGRKTLKEQLRDAIRRDGRTYNQLGKACGIGRDRLSRFMRNERDLTVDSIEDLCKALGLELRLVRGKPPKKTAPREEQQ